MSIEKKKQLAKKQIKDKFSDEQDPKCIKALRLVDLVAEAAIPVGYWFLRMEKFSGSEKLKEIVEKYMGDISNMYLDGQSICFAGNQGTGKTMSSICLLKQAIRSGFSAYYTTASDIMSDLTNYSNSWEIKQKLRMVDFLVIDELDSRFFPSDAQKELFSGIYENIFRYRAHNMLPTIICTNETSDILNVFYGAATQSIKSLNSQYLKIYPVAGLDFRKGNK